MRRLVFVVLLAISILTVVAIASAPDPTKMTKPSPDSAAIFTERVQHPPDVERSLAALREAKRRGDSEAARTLSQALGWPETDSPAPREDTTAKIVVRTELINADKNWGTDVLVSNPEWQSGMPAMAARTNGTLYLVDEDLAANYVDVYYSTDAGQSWTYWSSASDPGDPVHPAIAIGEGVSNRLIIAYETGSNTAYSAIKVWVHDLDTGQGNIITIESNPYFALKYPQVCVDNPEYNLWYPYLTYSKGILGKRNDFYNIRFSRSTNQGVNWSAPIDLATNVAYEDQPDIDFGGQNLYVVYTDYAGETRNVFLRRSSDFGTNWGPIVPLATTTHDEFEPRVAATNGGGTVLVGYTRTYSLYEEDIEAYYSRDAGNSWYHTYLPYFPNSERVVDLDVSRNFGKVHAAYFHLGWILYTSAHYSSPWYWAPVDTVNDVPGAMWSIRPTVAVDPNIEINAEQRIAWGDNRDDINFRVYFDAAVWDTAIIDPGGGGDYATIQDAIDAAGSNPVVIQLTNGVFTGPGNVDIDFLGKNITLQSLNGNPQTCIIDCQGSPDDPHRGVWIHNGEGPTAVVRGITIRNGYAAGGPLTDAGDGGGILIEGGSSPSLENLILEGNAASSGGGGVHYGIDSGGTAVFLLIFGNASSSGGGGVHYGINAGPTLINCTVVDNSGPVAGGMYCESYAHPTVENTIIAFSPLGMAVYCEPFAYPTLICCDVYGNAGGDWVNCIADQFGVDGNFAADPLFCIDYTGEYSLQTNSPCLPENNICGLLIGVYGVGCVIDAVEEEDTVPAQVVLEPNWPNPFNPLTTISFHLPAAGHVTLSIHTVTGKRVVTLIDRELANGAHDVAWNGRDAQGRLVASGTYFYRLQAAGHVLTRPMVLVR